MAKIVWMANPANIESVTLSDPSGGFGVRNVLEPDIALVPAGTPLVEEEPGAYSYEFPSEPGEQYEYYIKVVYPAESFYIYSIITASQVFDINTLYGVRKLLVDSSGRVDLVRDAASGDYSDSGLANFYINQAQRWLDRQLDNHSSKTRLFKHVPAGESIIRFSHARYVSSVFEVVGNDDYKPLKWMSFNPSEAPDSDKPKEWLHGVRIAPSSRDRMVLVHAVWYNNTLVEDSDRSWWTVNHPLLLVHATMRELEISMRNTQGVNDFEEPLLRDCKKIYDDLVAESMAGTTEHWRIQ